MSTHVSLNGCLYKLSDLKPTTFMKSGGRFIGHGRLVNPEGTYNGAPVVALYAAPGGYFYL